LPAAAGDVVAIAPGGECDVYIATRDGTGMRGLWRARRGDANFTAAALDALPASGVRIATDRGFCLGHLRNGVPQALCYDWYGRPIAESLVGSLAPQRRAATGSLATVALDSGIPRCRWHRVRIDADLPTATSVEVRIATTEDASAQPHAADWNGPAAGTLDFLVDQPPGRFLHVRIALAGDGIATPTVRRIRLDFPRSTSLEFLPAVYRENAPAEDFTERFLAIFDAEIEKVDRAIERFPALLDAAGVPDEVLPWLGGFLDVVFEPAWDPARRRELLRALPRLYALRGTVAGLHQAIRVLFDTEPVIQELGPERAWGKLGANGTAVLRGTRLFGRSRARMRLGRSALGSAPLMSRGNPDRDPVGAGAYRFRVLVPPLAREARARLERLVEAQKPAHTQAAVRMGGSGFLLGAGTALGVDTALVPLPAPVLGRAGNVRLARASVLWTGRRGPRPAIVIGQPIVVGLHTVME
jgi:phage tail-like protein